MSANLRETSDLMSDWFSYERDLYYIKQALTCSAILSSALQTQEAFQKKLLQRASNIQPGQWRVCISTKRLKTIHLNVKSSYVRTVDTV